MSVLHHKSGLAAIRDGRILLCRKRSGSGLLILPGGRIEEGESHLQCLLREISEELGPDAQLHQPTYLMTCESPGADGGTVRIELFTGTLEGSLNPQNEIAELHWFGPDEPWDTLAPSLRDIILPALIAQQLLISPAEQQSGGKSNRFS